MTVLLDSAGRKIRGGEATEESYAAAMRSLGALELLLLESAKPLGTDVDSRLGLLADEALELLRTRYTLTEQSRIIGPGDSSDESVRNLLASTVRRIPSNLLKGVKEPGFTYKQWRLTHLGAVVAIQAVSRIRQMLSSDDEWAQTALWGRGVSMETQVVPFSGEGRLRKGYVPFVLDMEGNVMSIGGGQQCLVRAWSPDVSRFRSVRDAHWSGSGSCFVEFPDGVDLYTPSGVAKERIDHPIFLWVLGCDLATGGKCQTMRVVRLFQPMTGLKRITRQMPDGTEEVVVDTLTGAEDKPIDNAR
jgi:hypothetical protein